VTQIITKVKGKILERNGKRYDGNGNGDIERKNQRVRLLAYPDGDDGTGLKSKKTQTDPLEPDPQTMRIRGKVFKVTKKKNTMRGSLPPLMGNTATRSTEAESQQGVGDVCPQFPARMA